MIAVDGCAGPGGWDLAARDLGIDTTGIEIDAATCRTRRAAGLPTFEADVTKFGPKDGRQAHGLIFSPVCTTYSRVGRGKGREAMDKVLEAVYEMRMRRPHVHGLDKSTALVLEPLRWAIEAAQIGRTYRWIALEQVPPVLPVWEEIAPALREIGYNVVTGICKSEQFGAPQYRRRAVLLASRDHEVQLPIPTHSEFYSQSPAKLDAGVLPWVSMAEALGWGTDHDKVREIVTPRVNNQSGTTFDLAWPAYRPAPTIAGRHLVTMPGANANRFNGATKSRNDGIRVSTQELGILQGFPADYPWQGTLGEQATQAGNAVPVSLAKALLSAVI